MLVRPPPPLSSVFSEQAKKVEKRNSCLATANAKDLYDIFYSSGGKGAPETKLGTGPLANGENSHLSKTENSYTSFTSPLTSSVSQKEIAQDRGLATAPVVRNHENPIVETVTSIGKRSIVKEVDSKSRDCSYSFLQPLTRLCQNRSYKTTPQTDTSAMWTNNSSVQSDTDGDLASKGQIKFDLGEPGPPGIDLDPQLSGTHCHTRESQTMVEVHLIDSGKESQELYSSKDCGKSEIETNTELKGRVAVKEGASVNSGPHSLEDSNLNYGNRYMWEGEVEQPELLMIDKEVEQSKKSMTEHETPSKVITESSAQAKKDSFPLEDKSLLQNPQDKPGKISTPELLLQCPARPDTYLTDNAQEQGVSGGSEEWLEHSAQESGSRTSRYRSLKFQRERSKDFQGKMICDLAVWDENKSPEKPEVKTVKLRDIHPELTATIENKALADFEAKHLKVKELATLGNLEDTRVDFCNTRLDPGHGPLTALSQKACEENFVSSAGYNPSTPSNFEAVSSFSGFPLDSPKTLVLNFATEGEHNSSNPRSGRIVSPNILKTGLPTENTDCGLGSLERTHQALDLLSGGRLHEEAEETSQLKKQESLRLESETTSPAGLGPSPCLPDLVDFVTRTSGILKEKLCSPFSDPDDPLKCSSLEMGPLKLEIPDVSNTEVAVLQADEESNNPLNLVKTPASESSSGEQVVGGSLVPQKITDEAAVSPFQNHTESSVRD